MRRAIFLATALLAWDLTPIELTPIELAPFSAAQAPVAPTAPGEYTYYCPRPAGYYPSVASCDFPWQAIPVTAPAGSIVTPKAPGGAPQMTPTVTPKTPTISPMGTPTGPT